MISIESKVCKLRSGADAVRAMLRAMGARIVQRPVDGARVAGKA